MKSVNRKIGICLCIFNIMYSLSVVSGLGGIESTLFGLCVLVFRQNTDNDQYQIFIK